MARTRPLPEDLEEAIRAAERYPFARPARSFVFRTSPGARLEPGWRDRRHPVLAIGANASPERLRLKFRAPAQAIPVERARLHDFAVVYASHFALYGAIPATLFPFPGAWTEVFVTWLDGDQLLAMHRSEGVGQRYACRTLTEIRLEVLDDAEGRHGGAIEAAAYVSRYGALRIDGSVVRVAPIAASAAGPPALDQRGVLEAARRRLEPGLDYAAFMSRIVACFGYRQRQTLALARDALPWPGDAAPPARRLRPSP